MLIEVVADMICPWCYVGKRRLEQALAQRPALSPRIRWRPFMLNPDHEHLSANDRAHFLTRLFGTESRVRQFFEAIDHAGQSVGIEFSFERIDFAPSSVDAHRLVQWASARARGEPVVEALYRAHFVAGADISDKAVLADVAASCGLPRGDTVRFLASTEGRTAVFEDNARIHQLGINGVPSFIFESSQVISGAQESSVLVRMLDLASVLSQDTNTTAPLPTDHAERQGAS